MRSVRVAQNFGKFFFKDQFCLLVCWFMTTIVLHINLEFLILTHLSKVFIYSTCFQSYICGVIFLSNSAEYVEEIYNTFKLASKGELKDAALKLKEMCPPPMNTMLGKQPKDEALQKRLDRSQMVIQDVPPTMSGDDSLQLNCFILFGNVFMKCQAIYLLSH